MFRLLVNKCALLVVVIIGHRTSQHEPQRDRGTATSPPGRVAPRGADRLTPDVMCRSRVDIDDEELVWLARSRRRQQVFHTS